MDRELQNRLITLLLKIPGIEDFGVRSNFLRGIPNSLSLSRNHSIPRTDISGIVDQLAEVRMQNGEWAILTIIDNAIPHLDGFMAGEQLKELRLQIEASFRPQPSQPTPPTQTDDEPINIFYCYAPEDERYCRELEKQLAVLRRNRLITSWHSLDILAGGVTPDETNSALRAADIVLLLVSPDFMASDRLYEEQVKPALSRREIGATRVIPIIVRDTAEWESSEFGKLAPLPPGKKSVKAWSNSDAAFASIATGIRKVVEDLRKTKKR